MIDISKIYGSHLTREDIEKKFAGSKSIDKLLTIFDKINALDGENEFFLSDVDFMKMRYAYRSGGSGR